MNWTTTKRNAVRFIGVWCLVVFAAACGEATQPDGGGDSITKQEAATLDGKSDHVDLCEYMHWYGDGICDTFCPEPDPDCDADYDPCGELACGETCTLCDPTDPTCVETAVVKYCQADGSCSAAVADCSDPEPYDPCEGLTCGDPCTLCAPDDPGCVETAELKFCHADGTCEGTQPQCVSPECTADSDCVVTGCSGQVCGSEPVVTTCEWREEYACYQQYGNCGCNDGVCGWADTPDLNQCLGD